MTPILRSGLLLPLLFLFGCAKGGAEDRPLSEVQIAASHHMFGFKSLAGFGTFPVPTTVVFTDHGVLNLSNDSTYTIARTGGTSSANNYALANDGDLTIYVSGTGHELPVVFRGAYALTGANSDMFFTDRVQTNRSPSIGLFVATKTVAAPVELAGDWHLASLHVIFDATLLSPDGVARAAWGTVAMAAGDPGTARAITGTGFQTSSTMTYGGTIQNLVQNTTSDGTCNLTIDYQPLGQNSDSRVFHAAARPDLVIGLDADETDGEVGLAFLIRKHDATNAPADPTSVAGVFHVGGYTAFVNPANPGADAFVGLLTLTAQGAFSLDAIGHQGVDFSYSGIFMLASDGGMTIAIDGTDEIWHGMIDRDYGTLVFLDDFRETRSNGVIELNLGFCVRQKPL